MKRYPAIGGDLHGMMLTSKDLEPESRARTDIGRYKAGDLISPGGPYGDHGESYHAYNRANGYSKGPTMVWLHESLL